MVVGSRRFAAAAVSAAAAASPPALRQSPPAAEARARAAPLRSRPAEGRAQGERDDSSLLLTVAASRVPPSPSPAFSSAGPGRAGAIAWSRSPCGPAGRGARAPGGQARQWCHSFVTSPRVSALRPARRSSFCYFFFVCLSGLAFLSVVLERKAGFVSALNFTSCHSPPPEKRFPFETHASNCRRGSKSWSLPKERGFVWFGM